MGSQRDFDVGRGELIHTEAREVPWLAWQLLYKGVAEDLHWSLPRSGAKTGRQYLSKAAARQRRRHAFVGLGNIPEVLSA